MAARTRELLRLDLGALDLRKGATGLLSILAFGVFVALFGNIGGLGLPQVSSLQSA